jgi:putative nucleotidyltransferase with HDIG domain
MSDAVLFVDDEPEVLDAYKRVLHGLFEVDMAVGGEEGLAAVRDHGPYPVVISDMQMAGMNGAQFLARVRQKTPDSVRMLLTGIREFNAAVEAVNEGNIFRFLTKPCEKEVLCEAITIGLVQYRLVVATREQKNWETLTALARAMDAQSAWTAGHSERVTDLALRIAKAMQLSADDLRNIERGGLLHDIGKIGTPLEILDKPGQLNSEETVKIREHVRIGVRILEPIAAFREVIPLVAEHREWFDGSGYPNQLSREGITLHARILAVADAFDAITSDRSYRKGLRPQEVLQIVRKQSGIQFDPKVVEVRVRVCGE